MTTCSPKRKRGVPESMDSTRPWAVAIAFFSTQPSVRALFPAGSVRTTPVAIGPRLPPAAGVAGVSGSGCTTPAVNVAWAADPSGLQWSVMSKSARRCLGKVVSTRAIRSAAALTRRKAWVLGGSTAAGSAGVDDAHGTRSSSERGGAVATLAGMGAIGGVWAGAAVSRAGLSLCCPTASQKSRSSRTCDRSSKT